MTFKSKVKVMVTFGTKKLTIPQCLWLGPSNSVEMLVLTSRWSWGQRSKSLGPLVLKSLITWQCLGLGPLNLEGMLVLTSRWHRGQKVMVKITMTFSTKKLGPSNNLEGMLVLTSRWQRGQKVMVKITMTFSTKKLIIRQCLRLEHLNLVGLTLMAKVKVTVT